MNWIKLHTLEQLNEIDAASASQPVIIFKHSTRCSISAMAKNRLDLDELAQERPEMKAYYLDLIVYRDVSNEIALRYNVEHQSPQILIIKDGNCVAHTSHGGVKNRFVIENT